MEWSDIREVKYSKRRDYYENMTSTKIRCSRFMELQLNI